MEEISGIVLMYVLHLEMTQEYWVRIWRTGMETQGMRAAFLWGDSEFKLHLQCHWSMVWWIWP